MSKFCGNCGTQLDDDARVCGNCGTPCIERQKNSSCNNVKIPGVNGMSPQKKKRIKLISILSILAVILIIATIITVNIVNSITEYNGAIKKYMDAYLNYDIETLTSMASDINYSYKDEDEIEESISGSVSSALDSYENAVGYDMNLSYEVTDVYELSERKYQEFLDYVESSYDYDTSDITEIVLAKITVYATGSLGESEFVLSDLYFINERGSWYYFKGYIGNNYSSY